MGVLMVQRRRLLQYWRISKDTMTFPLKIKIIVQSPERAQEGNQKRPARDPGSIR